MMDSNIMNIKSVSPELKKEPENLDTEVLYDDEEFALDIIKKAELEAKAIRIDALKKAEEEIELRRHILKTEIKEERSKSHDEGYKEGYDEGLKESLKLKEEAELIYENTIKEREELLKNIEGETINLIINIVKKLLDDTVEMNPDVILVLIKKGLAETTLSGDISIKVSSDDYEYVLKNKEKIVPFMDSGSKLEIIRDLSLRKSDCIIETPFGNIDCSLDEQFNLLKENLFFLLENRRDN